MEPAIGRLIEVCMPFHFLRAGSGRRGLAVLAAVSVLFSVTGGLALLVSNTISTITETANKMDDQRSEVAVRGAVRGLQLQLAATVRDNAYWDQAADAMKSPQATNWIFDTWGMTSKDYPLYDTVVVVDPAGRVVAAYHQGKPLASPEAYFGKSFSDIVSAARMSRDNIPVGFVAAQEGVSLVSAAVVSPYLSKDNPRDADVLVFSKVVQPSAVAEIGDNLSLRRLFMSEMEQPGVLRVPLLDVAGAAVGYLNWFSANPGTASYTKAADTVFFSTIGLFVLLSAFCVFGLAELRAIGGEERKARHRATHDVLTGLLNRAGLLDRMDEILAAGTSGDAAFHLLDLDGFKAVNDTFGHAAGDMLIRAVGARLAASVPPDSVVARLGGDEFAFISVSRQPPDPTATLDRVFGAPFEIGGRTIEIGGSAGVATLEAGLGRDAVLRRADLALYRAKDMGRGVAVRFDEAIGAEAVRLDELETELRAAVEAGKIDVVFQPLVEAATNDMVGVEALARWTSPTRGAVGPDVFVAIAEKAGFVGALGMQVLDKALEEARAWPGLGVSVNVSPLQLRDPGFPGEVKETLDRRGFDPNLLTVEVTEGVLIANREQAARAFDALRAFGVRIALDDFGSGFASIGALREFKFDRMKIDRSLVWALERDDEASAVLDATIRLASAMRIAVTAEGVETETQARFVTASGCDNLQGYLFGKPVPASEVMARRFRFPLALSA